MRFREIERIMKKNEKYAKIQQEEATTYYAILIADQALSAYAKASTPENKLKMDDAIAKAQTASDSLTNTVNSAGPK